MKSTEFRKLITDALEHLYDPAYLEVHPLLSQITSEPTPNRATRAQKLRALLKESIETLRPPQGTPSRSPEWRSYLALRCRYVQDMTMGQVESELGISRRQLQREIQKGLEALASILWSSHGGESESNLPVPTMAAVPELESELNQWDLSRHACELRLLVNDALGLLKSALEEGRVHVHVDIPASLALVFVDATLTRQALLMILRLLTQHSPGPVTLTAAQNENYMEIQLHSPAGHPSPAESDWEAPRMLFHLQGGVLSVEGRTEQELQVNIRLPLADQTRVLVIDDNPAILRLFERYLTPQHFEVLKAYSGADVLALAAETRPAVIILDVMMPNLDGWQVLRNLKENPATASTPIIICSVLTEPELAFSLGAHAYLKKPVERLELLSMVERLLNPEARAKAAPPPEPPNS
jgi:CheY-like chemotaxis protein